MTNTSDAPVVTAENVHPTNPYTVAEGLLSAAYSDCHEHRHGARVPGRNLNFCCPVTVTLEEAQRLLARYVPSYNVFEPKLLGGLPKNCRVRLARESSVCLYVETRRTLDEGQTRRDLHCDEFDLCQVLGTVRTYRLWWD